MRKVLNILFLMVAVALLLYAAYYNIGYIMSNVPHEDTLYHKITYDFPHKFFVMILENQQLDRIMILIFLPVILLSIWLSIFSVLIVLGFVLLRRTVHIYLEKIRFVLSYRMQGLIIQYLTENNNGALNSLKKFKSAFAKNILINELLVLQTILVGLQATQVNKLYMMLNLYEFSLRKTRSPFLHIRIHHIRVLSRMNVKHVSLLIKKYLSSTNKELRLETQLAILNLNHNTAFDFLSATHLTLSKWHQIVLYDTVLRHTIPLPDFTQYIITSNKSVVIFCLRMIRMFRQQDAYQVVIHLLRNESPTIRKHAVRTLGELGIKEAVSVLKDLYTNNNEDMTLCLEIVRSIAKIGGNEALKFALSKLNTADFRLQMEIIRAIRQIDQLRVHQLSLISESQTDEQTLSILCHCNDKRIE